MKLVDLYKHNGKYAPWMSTKMKERLLQVVGEVFDDNMEDYASYAKKLEATNRLIDFVAPTHGFHVRNFRTAIWMSQLSSVMSAPCFARCLYETKVKNFTPTMRDYNISIYPALFVIKAFVPPMNESRRWAIFRHMRGSYVDMFEAVSGRVKEMLRERLVGKRFEKWVVHDVQVGGSKRGYEHLLESTCHTFETTPTSKYYSYERSTMAYVESTSGEVVLHHETWTSGDGGIVQYNFTINCNVNVYAHSEKRKRLFTIPYALIDLITFSKENGLEKLIPNPAMMRTYTMDGIKIRSLSLYGWAMHDAYNTLPACAVPYVLSLFDGTKESLRELDRLCLHCERSFPTLPLPDIARILPRIRTSSYPLQHRPMFPAVLKGRRWYSTDNRGVNIAQEDVQFVHDFVFKMRSVVNNLIGTFVLNKQRTISCVDPIFMENVSMG